MYQGRTNQVAKIWASVGGQQIGELQSGIAVTGDAPSGGYALIRTPRAGFTKTQWLTGYAPVPVTPLPPVDPPAEALPDVLYIGTTRENVQEYRKAA